MAVAASLCALSLLFSLLPHLTAKQPHRRSPLTPPTSPNTHHPTLPKPPPSKFPQNFSCSGLLLMLKRKKMLLISINHRVDEIKGQPVITTAEKLKMEIFQIYERELKAAGSSLLMVLRDLNQTLGSDYRSLAQVKRSCQMRLDDMKNAAVMVEEDFNSILELEKEMRSLHPNINLTHNPIIAEIMSEISHAADTLESELTAADVFQDSRKQDGAALETVVKLKEEVLAERHNLAYVYKKKLTSGIGKERESEGGAAMAMLVDSASNQYVLSHPRDVTVPIEDHHLVHDIVNLFLLSFALGSLCSLINVPPLLGHILAGLLLGPVGYNMISSVIQVETIGEFGVVFIVFCVALDFSPEKLRKVWQVAVYGGNLLLIGGSFLGVVSGASVGVRVRVSLVVVACLSLSSAPLAHRILDGTIYSRPRTTSMSDDLHRPYSPPEAEHSDVTGYLNGLLVMQDIQLGTLVALMPIFADDPTSVGRWNFAAMLYGFIQLLQTLCGFCLLVIIARQLTNRILEKFYRLLNSVRSKTESVVLGSVAVCFLLLVAADYLGASMELGCFLAGLAISSQGHTVVEQVKRLVEPLRDFFSVFFFASLGFHIFPTFLMSEFSMILGVTFCVVILKFLLSLSILGIFSGHCRISTWVLALGLAQVSEFSFLLASRARRLDIISREVYLITLSISSLSLLITPLVWRLYLVGVSINWTSIQWPLFKWHRLSSTE